MVHRINKFIFIFILLLSVVANSASKVLYPETAQDTTLVWGSGAVSRATLLSDGDDATYLSGTNSFLQQDIWLFQDMYSIGDSTFDSVVVTIRVKKNSGIPAVSFHWGAAGAGADQPGYNLCMLVEDGEDPKPDCHCWTGFDYNCPQQVDTAIVSSTSFVNYTLKQTCITCSDSGAITLTKINNDGYYWGVRIPSQANGGVARLSEFYLTVYYSAPPTANPKPVYLYANAVFFEPYSNGISRIFY